jgi:hypothetical protein
MTSRTPRFDEAIDRYFRTLSAGNRVCPETGDHFKLSQAILDLHKLLRTPPSKITPWARVRRLRASLQGSDFFQRIIEDDRTIITNYDPDSRGHLLPSQEWYAKRAQDSFLSYGCAVDVSRSFFEQWEIFSRKLPRPALIQDPQNEKSEWTSYCSQSKNCYFGYNAWGNTDCLYCDYGLLDANCCDVTGSDRVEWSYDCTRSDDNSHIFFCERCTFSLNLYFCLNCVNCHDCFGSTNLKNKKYYFLNEPLSEEEYKKRLSAIDLSDHRVLAKWKEQIKTTYWKTAPHKALVILSCENVEGDDLLECRDSTGVGYLGCERIYDSFGIFKSKDSASLVSILESERCLYSQNIEYGYENKMCSICISCIDVEYCELLLNCEHCFGCIGLQNKKYCIFNTQYGEDAYWQIVDQLKTTMLERGEYGEYFPYSSFSNAYNTSNAEELLTHAFRCENSGRLYRIVKPELEWHRKFRLALPRLHPTIRSKERALELYPLWFETNECASCHQSIQTRIPRSRGYPLYCQPCYEKTMLAGSISVNPSSV